MLDKSTVVLLGLEEDLWEGTRDSERFSYHAVTVSYFSFLILSLGSSVFLVYLIVSSWWLAVPVGAMLCFVIGSVIRFSLIILRRSIFDPFLALPETKGRKANTAAEIVVPVNDGLVFLPPPGNNRVTASGEVAAASGQNGALGTLRIRLARLIGRMGPRIMYHMPGLGSLLRLVIVSTMGCLVVFPLACIFHFEAVERLNGEKRAVLLATHMEDAKGVMEARTAWIDKRIAVLERELEENAGIYRADGLRGEKTAELNSLRKDRERESAGIEEDLARQSDRYRQELEESHFLLHSFRSVAAMTAFKPVAALVAALLIIPHFLLAVLKSRGEGSYAETSTLHYRSIIDAAYSETEESGYALLDSKYRYRPEEFKRNIHWENTPYNTVPRKVFKDRERMPLPFFEMAMHTKNPTRH